LEYTLNDEVLNRQTKVTSTGQTVSVGVDKAGKNDSHFSFGNPVYNLGFTLTPGSMLGFLSMWQCGRTIGIGLYGFRSWRSICHQMESILDAMPGPPVSRLSGPNLKQGSQAG